MLLGRSDSAGMYRLFAPELLACGGISLQAHSDQIREDRTRIIELDG